MSHINTQTLDRCYLEYSQITKAKTEKESQLEAKIESIRPLFNPDDPGHLTIKVWQEAGFALGELRTEDCGHCDGCGTYEGGPEYMFTNCKKCNGHGFVIVNKQGKTFARETK